MPLTPAAARRKLHTRSIVIAGYERDDGLWDIEARLIDTKTYGFANHDRGGRIEAGEPLHEMLVRVTIDSDMTIHAVEAVTEHAPFRVCPEIAPSFAGLAGLRIGRGFLAELRRRFGGAAGCTHIVELFGQIATTAYQTLAGQRQGQGDSAPRAARLNTCHALAADSPVVARMWPDLYEGPLSPGTDGD